MVISVPLITGATIMSICGSQTSLNNLGHSYTYWITNSLPLRSKSLQHSIQQPRTLAVAVVAAVVVVVVVVVDVVVCSNCWISNHTSRVL